MADNWGPVLQGLKATAEKSGVADSPLVVAVPGTGPLATGATTLPQPVCPYVYQHTLSVSATVEYSVH
jgi:hypothetical protein